MISFFVAAVLASAIGISTAMQSFETQEHSMSSKDKVIIANDSVNGAARMRGPQPDSAGRSVNGAAKLKPAQPTAQPQAKPPSSPAQPANTSTSNNPKGK
jgi:hypothetical protein